MNIEVNEGHFRMAHHLEAEIGWDLSISRKCPVSLAVLGALGLPFGSISTGIAGEIYYRDELIYGGSLATKEIVDTFDEGRELQRPIAFELRF